MEISQNFVVFSEYMNFIVCTPNDVQLELVFKITPGGDAGIYNFVYGTLINSCFFSFSLLPRCSKINRNANLISQDFLFNFSSFIHNGDNQNM